MQAPTPDPSADTCWVVAPSYWNGGEPSSRSCFPDNEELPEGVTFPSASCIPSPAQARSMCSVNAKLRLGACALIAHPTGGFSTSHS